MGLSKMGVNTLEEIGQNFGLSPASEFRQIEVQALRKPVTGQHPPPEVVCGTLICVLTGSRRSQCGSGISDGCVRRSSGFS